MTKCGLIIAAGIVCVLASSVSRANDSEISSNWIATDGSKYRIRSSGEDLFLESADGDTVTAHPIKYCRAVHPSGQPKQILLGTWGTSATPLLVAVTKRTERGRNVFHALFFYKGDYSVNENAQCFAMTVFEGERDHKIISINGSFKTDSTIIVLGELSSVSDLRAVERGVVWMCDCPNDHDGSYTISSFDSTKKTAKID